MNTEKLSIAMIGFHDQVTFMRLAGVGAWRTVSNNDADTREQTRQALADLLKDPSIGILIIPDDLTPHIKDELEHLRQHRSLFPLIVEMPVSLDVKPGEIREYYKSYAKRLIGFSIEI